MTGDKAGRPTRPPRQSSSAGNNAAIDEAAIDFAFLDAQTFGDAELRREVLGLFAAQSRRLIPSLPAANPREQADTAHLLKGSARGIGAWAAADSADAYEAAVPERRAALFPALEAAFARVEAAIVAGGPSGNGPGNARGLA